MIVIEAYRKSSDSRLRVLWTQFKGKGYKWLKAISFTAHKNSKQQFDKLAGLEQTKEQKYQDLGRFTSRNIAVLFLSIKK